MEKKTIGGFISALRKANGMTQKDLSERLNVSDKSVSRWENDEGAPDLSLIPVIAEIFGVTCDELLRGERKSPEERSAEENTAAESTPKGEKQRQRMLKTTLSKYQSLTYISMGITAAGLITALICNLAFTKAVLGFLLSAIFFAASIITQAIFVNRANLAVDDAGLSEEELSGFKRRMIRLAEQSVGLTVGCFGFVFPLAFIDAYMGLGSDSLFLFGGIGTAVFLAIYAVVKYVLNYAFFEKGVYTLSEKEEAVYRHNHKLKKRVALVTTAVLAITLIVHVAISEIWGAYEIMENMDGAVFEEYDRFGEYMSQDIGYGWGYTDSHTAPVDVPEDYEDIRTITDDSGNVLYEYDHRNDSVIRIRHDGGLPITVYTQGHLRGAENIVLLRNAGFVVLYLIEAAAGILIYRKKREK